MVWVVLPICHFYWKVVNFITPQTTHVWFLCSSETGEIEERAKGEREKTEEEMATPPTTPVGSKPKFEFPVIHENPSGWGPCEVPEQFKDTPYQPFSKGDRLGKVANYQEVWICPLSRFFRWQIGLETCIRIREVQVCFTHLIKWIQWILILYLMWMSRQVWEYVWCGWEGVYLPPRWRRVVVPTGGYRPASAAHASEVPSEIQSGVCWREGGSEGSDDWTVCVYVQQKIRRDREKREERRMGGKQQVAKGKHREM